MNIRTSPLVEYVNEAKRPTRWWLAWIVAVIMIVGGSLGGSLVGQKVLGDPDPSQTRAQFAELFGFGASMLLLFLWVRFKEGRRFSSVGFRGSRAIPRLILGLLIGAIMMSIGVAIPLLTGDLANGASQHTNLGTAALAPVAILLFVFIFQSSTEEAITRGYMVQTGGRDLRPLVAIIGPAVIFALVHLNFAPIPVINTVLFAVAMSFLALGQGGLWLVCGIHAGWNFFQGNVYGIPVSGNGLANSVFGLGPTTDANEMMTGGDYGVEASLSATVVLVIVLVISIVYYRRQDARRSVGQGAAAAVGERLHQ